MFSIDNSIDVPYVPCPLHVHCGVGPLDHLSPIGAPMTRCSYWVPPKMDSERIHFAKSCDITPQSWRFSDQFRPLRWFDQRCFGTAGANCQARLPFMVQHRSRVTFRNTSHQVWRAPRSIAQLGPRVWVEWPTIPNFSPKDLRKLRKLRNPMTWAGNIPGHFFGGKSPILTHASVRCLYDFKVCGKELIFLGWSLTCTQTRTHKPKARFFVLFPCQLSHPVFFWKKLNSLVLNLGFYVVMAYQHCSVRGTCCCHPFSPRPPFVWEVPPCVEKIAKIPAVQPGWMEKPSDQT